MSDDENPIQRRLQELQLIQCSLLPDEHLNFHDDSSAWGMALTTFGTEDTEKADLKFPICVTIRLDGANVWFEVRFEETVNVHAGGDREPKMGASCVSVKGEDITRSKQEEWNSIIADKMQEISDSDFPMYQLITLHLLPLLHERHELESNLHRDDAITDRPVSGSKDERFHVLFTSHHLISPHKRRDLQQWSSSLSLTGFAKVGYPGVIYAEGDRANIEEFVENVKAMQWLALKVRFVEPVPNNSKSGPVQPVAVDGHPRWKEFQKVGKVVEEMRRLGREEYVVEMGIGSAGTR